MNLFVMGVFEEIEKECRAGTLDDNMDTSRSMFHAQQVNRVEKEK